LAQAAIATCLLAVGCGMPGAPQPPSLNLPQPVHDLRAVRTGDEVSLAWTMPRRNTDQLLLKDSLRVKICRSEGHDATCSSAGQVTLAPSAPGVFTEQIPAALVAGSPRALAYFVQVENLRGKSAGPSNLAHVVAGQAPPPVTAFQAEVRKAGVVLHWTPVAGDATSVRLERRLLTPHLEKKKTDPFEAPPEPATQNLLITARVAEGRALDRTPRFGESYEYRAQRVARVTVDDQTLELAGAPSNAINVDVRDVFPPDAPQGLAAVAGAPESGAVVDLNWQPGTEADVAGYVVYRREADGAWQRVSPAKPLPAPAFHDATVRPGHTYRYVVTAVDQGNRESPRSAETEENVPAE
jgi:hypothetical protein